MQQIKQVDEEELTTPRAKKKNGRKEMWKELEKKLKVWV
jgi:hypothetical protein